MNDTITNSSTTSNNSNSKRTNKRIKIILKKDEVEKKITELNPELSNKEKFHDYFASYDFHAEENYIKNFWKSVIEYIIVHMKNEFFIPFGELLQLCRFQNKEPIGLFNIVTHLIREGDYLLIKHLESEEYYKENFPELFPKQTWGQYFKTAVTSRIWSSSKDLEISDDTLIIEKKSFLVNFFFYLYFRHMLILYWNL